MVARLTLATEVDIVAIAELSSCKANHVTNASRHRNTTLIQNIGTAIHKYYKIVHDCHSLFCAEIQEFAKSSSSGYCNRDSGLGDIRPQRFSTTQASSKYLLMSGMFSTKCRAINRGNRRGLMFSSATSGDTKVQHDNCENRVESRKVTCISLVVQPEKRHDKKAGVGHEAKNQRPLP